MSITYPTTAEEMEHILQKVDSYKICSGGPSIKYYKSVHSECAFKDESNWRHNKCPIILGKGTICMHCVDLHRLLSRSLDNQKFTKKRIRLPKSLRSVNLVMEIRRRGYICKRRLTRREKIIKKLKEDLNESAKQISNLKETTILDAIEKLNIPEEQVKSLNYRQKIIKCWTRTLLIFKKKLNIKILNF